LKLISKELEPSSGSISVRDRVSYLPQKTTNFSEQNFGSNFTCGCQTVCIEQSGARISDGRGYLHNWRGLELTDGHPIGLESLHLAYLSLDRTGHSLSGGEMMRCLLARLLLEKVDLVLLDEPTNNLDLGSKIQFMTH